MIVLYNKFSEINSTRGTSFKQLCGLLKRMDEQIMSKVIQPIIEDINRVAHRKASNYLT